MFVGGSEIASLISGNVFSTHIHALDFVVQFIKLHVVQFIKLYIVLDFASLFSLLNCTLFWQIHALDFAKQPVSKFDFQAQFHIKTGIFFCLTHRIKGSMSADKLFEFH